MKTKLIPFLSMLMVGFGAGVARAETVATEIVIEPISPAQGAERLAETLMLIYLALLKVIPGVALIAMAVAAFLTIIFLAVGSFRLAKITGIGVAIIVLMVVIAYAAPHLVAMAQGVAEGLN